MKLNLYCIHDASNKARERNIQDTFNIIANIHGLQDTKLHIISSERTHSSFNDVCQPNVPAKIPALNHYILNGTESTLYPHASCAQKHFEAIRKIASSPDDDGSLSIVLEDDCCISPGNIHILPQTIQDLYSKRNSYDFVYLSYNDSQSQSQNKDLISQTNVIQESSCAYFISKKTAAKLVDSFLPINYPINIHLAQCVILAQLTLFTINYKLFVDGSKSGNFSSTILLQNTHSFDPQYVEYMNEPSKYLHLMTDPKFNENPDYIYLKGKGHMEAGNLTLAKESFDKAFSLYKQENSAVFEIPKRNHGGLTCAKFYDDYITLSQKISLAQ